MEARSYLRNFIIRLQNWIQDNNYVSSLNLLITKESADLHQPVNGYVYFNKVLQVILLPETYSHITSQTPLALYQFLDKITTASECALPEEISGLLWNCFSILQEDQAAFNKIAWLLIRFKQEYDKRFKWILPVPKRDALSIVEEAHNVLPFDSIWETADFLQTIGYQVMASHATFLLFHKYTGYPVFLQYKDWVETLAEVNGSIEEQVWWDKVLTFCTTQKQGRRFPSFLCDGDTCQLCPLQADCHFFDKEFADTSVGHIEKSLLTANFDKLSTEELAKYVLVDIWSGSKKQTELLSLFSFLNLSSFIAFRETQQEVMQIMYCRLLAVYELGSRFLESEKNVKLPYLKTAKEIYEFILPRIKNKMQEEFYVLLFNAKQKLLWVQMVSVGLLDRVLAHPREVLRIGLSLQTSLFIVVHNHPSNVVKPSYADIEMTKRLKAAGDIVGLTLIDHIIVGKENQYYSFKEQA